MGCNTSKESVQPVEEDKNEGEAQVGQNGENKETKPSSAETEKSAATPVTDTASEHDRGSPTDADAPKSGVASNVNVSRLEPSEKEVSTQDEQEERVELEVAATKIQAVFRGHQARKEMKEADQQDEPTREQLEAEFPLDDKELCKAASTIQATFRNHMKSKHEGEPAPKEESGEHSKEAHEKTVEDDLADIDLTDPDLNKAATKIQASFRGHKVRKDTDTH